MNLAPKLTRVTTIPVCRFRDPDHELIVVGCCGSSLEEEKRRKKKKKLSLWYCTSLLTTWNFTPGDMGPLYFPLHASLLLLRGTGKKQEEEEAETKK
jgi:predicted nucleic acid-binding Zn ribbon protein